jgi:hypothetical protein
MVEPGWSYRKVCGRPWWTPTTSGRGSWSWFGGHGFSGGGGC